jgi:hypothetical protein
MSTSNAKRVETLPDLPAEIAAHKALEALTGIAIDPNTDSGKYLIARAIELQLEATQEAHSATQAAPTVSIKEVPIKATCGLCGASSAVSYDASLQPSCIDQAACMARRNTPVTPACKSGTYTVVLR